MCICILSTQNTGSPSVCLGDLDGTTYFLHVSDLTACISVLTVCTQSGDVGFYISTEWLREWLVSTGDKSKCVGHDLTALHSGTRVVRTDVFNKSAWLLRPCAVCTDVVY